MVAFSLKTGIRIESFIGSIIGRRRSEVNFG